MAEGPSPAGSPGPYAGTAAEAYPAAYAATGQQTTGNGAPGGQPYAAPGGEPYGGPGGAYPGYPPTGQQAPQGYGTPGNQGYGTPGGQGYGTPGSQGYGTPGGQPHPGYAYPGYPQQPGYGQYRASGNGTGRDPALAEWWRRLLARVIDGVILAVIFSPLWYPPWHAFLRQLQSVLNRYPGSLANSAAAHTAIVHAESHFFSKILVVFVLFYPVAFAYDWVQHAAWGQTIGKRVLGTRVVMADSRANVGVGPAGARAAVYALPGLVPFVGGLFSLLNELWLLWDPRRQCLHDKAAHTVVVKNNP
jgi:uncharacterized RDD family membrane protein YckC